MSVRRWFVTLAALLVAVAGAEAPRPARAQLVTVTVQSVDELVNQFRTLAEAFDPENAQPVVAQLDQLEKNDFLNGVDRTRPVAATFEMLRQPGAGPLGFPKLIVFIPVTDQEKFLESLKKLGVGSDDLVVDGFTSRLLLVGTGAPPFFVLKDPPKGYLVATNDTTNPEKVRAIKPEELRPAKAGLISALGRFDKIPPSIKEGLLEGAAQRLAGERQRKEKESDADYKARLAGLETVNKAFTSLVNDSQTLKLDLNVGSKSKRLSMALELGAKPDTLMSKTFASVGNLKSSFRGISPEAAVSISAVLPIPDTVRDAARELIKHGREAAKDQDDDEDTNMINLLLDAVEPTVTGDRIDGTVILDFPVAPDKDKDDEDSGPNVVLFGVGLKGSKKLEAALRESVTKGAKPDNADEIKLDAEKADDGTPIHRVKLDDDQIKTDGFGEPLMFIAFPEGSALIAVGENGLPVIKQALAGLKKPAGASDRSPAQVEIDVLANRFSRIYQDEATAELYSKAAATAFAGKNAGKDHLQIGLTFGPDSVRLSLESDLPVFNFLAEIGTKRK